MSRRLTQKLALTFALTVTCALVAGCSNSMREEATNGSAPQVFEEVGRTHGVDFVHNDGGRRDYFMPQSIGSGVALFDFDNDGRLDLYMVQNGGPDSSLKNQLYRQTSDGNFENVSNGSGLDRAGYGMGVAAGDVNNDGQIDVLLTEFGGIHLFLNRGGTFHDVSGQAGVSSPLWATSAAMVDYDRDGFLDLVVVNYVDYDPARPCGSAAGKRDFCAPREFEGTVTKLFHNVGPQDDGSVRFDDITIKSGIGLVVGPGLGVLPADFNGDHWPDLLVANDGQPNRLWINRQDGTFEDQALQRGLAYNARGVAEANMGVAWGDVDGDALPDVFITHLTDETHTLWRQEMPGQFQDRTVSAKISEARGTGFGTALFDLDCDGDLDLAIANGRISRRADRLAESKNFWRSYAEQNHLLLNDGRGNFQDASPSYEDFARENVARGLATGDLDNDGRLDLVVTTIGGRPRILRNTVKNENHWLLVRAVDPELHRDAYGAEITVSAGQQRWTRLIQPAQSFLSSSDPRAHFGIRSNSAIASIEVVWPDGTPEEFAAAATDQQIVLQRGTGKPKQ
jgi:enediyne biosynthesis protein E4